MLAVGLEDAGSLTLAPTDPVAADGDTRMVAGGLTLRVAGRAGVFDVSPNGAVTRAGEPADAVTSSPVAGFALRSGELAFATGPAHAVGLPADIGDIVAIEGGVVALAADALWLAGGGDTPPTRVSLGCTDALATAHAVALGRDGAEVLLVSDTSVVAVRLASGADAAPCVILAEGLSSVRAAATDAHGRVFVVADDDPALYLLSPAPVVAARWLGQVRDAHFGAGPYPAENLYFVDAEGRLTYVRPPLPGAG